MASLSSGDIPSAPSSPISVHVLPTSPLQDTPATNISNLSQESDYCLDGKAYSYPLFIQSISNHFFHYRVR